MKSTEKIHEIVEEFGGENKGLLMILLKTLRKQVHLETIKPFRKCLDVKNYD